MINLQVNAYINATLTNGYTVSGQVDFVGGNSFMIDDNTSGDIFQVDFTELDIINEYVEMEATA